jgi:hypothetical protein
VSRLQTLASTEYTRYMVTMDGSIEVSVAMRMDAMRSDLVRGLVWFVNYAAIDPSSVKASDLDLHGAAMLPEDVERFAHRWLAFARSVDIEHDGVGRPVDVVESFFNSPDVASPFYPVNAHVTRLDVSKSPEAHEGLRSGRLNSVSLDAITFNKVIRLPVSTFRSVAVVPGVPSLLSDWAAEAAACGYDGVVGVREIFKGLFVAERSGGRPPLAVSLDADSVEMVPGSGPWSKVAAAIFQSPTLTSRSACAPAVDFSPWPKDEVGEMMRSIGLDPSGSLSVLGSLESEVFAAVDEASMKGFLPHHTVRAGEVMTSRDGVTAALCSIDSVPERLRPMALEHLQRHLAEVSS